MSTQLTVTEEELVQKPPQSLSATVSYPRFGKHLPELDGLRGLAIVMVAVFHFSEVFAKLPGPLNYLRTLCVPGWTGVDLFFALSGFLITNILLDSKGKEAFFRRFYVRRMLRIFPVYYGALLACFLIFKNIVTVNGDLPSMSVTLAYFFHVSNWLSLCALEIPALNHFWSLAVEEQFYLCWPLAVYLLSRSNLVRLGWSLVIGAPLLRYYVLTNYAQSDAARIAYALTPARLDTLAIGALLALALRHDATREWLTKFAPRIIAVCVVMLLVWFATKSRLGLDYPCGVAMLTSLLAITFGLMVFHAAVASGTHGGISWLLRLRPLQFAGRVSYAAYVIHFPLFMGTVSLLDFAPASLKVMLTLGYFVAGIGSTFLLAALSWHLIEKKILRYKEVLAPTRTASQSPRAFSS